MQSKNNEKEQVISAFRGEKKIVWQFLNRAHAKFTVQKILTIRTKSASACRAPSNWEVRWEPLPNPTGAAQFCTQISSRNHSISFICRVLCVTEKKQKRGDILQNPGGENQLKKKTQLKIQQLLADPTRGQCSLGSHTGCVQLVDPGDKYGYYKGYHRSSS